MVVFEHMHASVENTEHLLMLDVSCNTSSKVKLESCYQPATTYLEVNISKRLVYCKSNSRDAVSTNWPPCKACTL